jgi:hypothetical protein
MNIVGGERRARSQELDELARSIRALITDRTAADAVSAYEGVASDIDRERDIAFCREHGQSETEAKNP